MALAVTDEERLKLLDGASSDLKYILADVEVSDDLQLKFFKAGFKNLKIFSGVSVSQFEITK